MGSNKDRILPNIQPRYSYTQGPVWDLPTLMHQQTQAEQSNNCHQSLTHSRHLSVCDDWLPVLTVEQLLRLGVALPVRGCCCMVKAAAILLMSFGSGSGPLAGATGPGLRLSLDQDGTSGRAMPAADTWAYPGACRASSNWERAKNKYLLLFSQVLLITRNSICAALQEHKQQCD